MAIDEEKEKAKIERVTEEKKYEKEIRRIEVQVSTKHATSPPHPHAQCRGLGKEIACGRTGEFYRVANMLNVWRCDYAYMLFHSNRNEWERWHFEQWKCFIGTFNTSAQGEMLTSNIFRSHYYRMIQNSINWFWDEPLEIGNDAGAAVHGRHEHWKLSVPFRLEIFDELWRKSSRSKCRKSSVQHSLAYTFEKHVYMCVIGWWRGRRNRAERFCELQKMLHSLISSDWACSLGWYFAYT